MTLIIYITGWWLTYPSEKYEFVNWDDEIPNLSQSMIIYGKMKVMFRTTNRLQSLYKLTPESLWVFFRR